MIFEKFCYWWNKGIFQGVKIESIFAIHFEIQKLSSCWTEQIQKMRDHMNSVPFVEICFSGRIRWRKGTAKGRDSQVRVEEDSIFFQNCIQVFIFPVMTSCDILNFLWQRLDLFTLSLFTSFLTSRITITITITSVCYFLSWIQVMTTNENQFIQLLSNCFSSSLICADRALEEHLDCWKYCRATSEMYKWKCFLLNSSFFNKFSEISICFCRCDVAVRLVSLRSPFVNDVLSVVVRMLEETSKSCGKHSQEHCQVDISSHSFIF